MDGAILGIFMATFAGQIKSAMEKHWLRKEIECYIAPGEKVASYNATVIIGENGDISWIDNNHGVIML